jgi:hypothetical protein
MIRIVALLLLLSLTGVTYAQQREFVTGVSKSMTVDEARQEAFRTAKPWVDVSGFPTVDPNFLSNRHQVQKGGGKVGDRLITVFKYGQYSVHSLKEEMSGPFVSQYFLSNGLLIAIEFDDGGQHISKSYKHSAINNTPYFNKGQLIAINLSIGGKESYIFSTDGLMIAHWIGNKCYNTDGSSCGTRRSFIAAED